MYKHLVLCNLWKKIHNMFRCMHTVLHICIQEEEIRLFNDASISKMICVKYMQIMHTLLDAHLCLHMRYVHRYDIYLCINQMYI